MSGADNAFYPRQDHRHSFRHGSCPVLGELGKDGNFGDLATRGRAEKAVLDLLASA
jgi:hypothetical protein